MPEGKNALVQYYEGMAETAASSENRDFEARWGLADAAQAPAGTGAPAAPSSPAGPAPGAAPAASLTPPASDEIVDRLAQAFSATNKVAPEEAKGVVRQILDSPDSKWDPVQRKVVTMTFQEKNVRRDELKAGPDESWRSWITRNVGRGFAQTKVGGEEYDVGLADFVPGLEVGASVGDVASIKDREAAGEKVGLFEKALTYLSVPLSALPIVGGVMKPVKGAAKALDEVVGKGVKAVLPPEPSIFDKVAKSVEDEMLARGAVNVGEPIVPKTAIDPNAASDEMLSLSDLKAQQASSGGVPPGGSGGVAPPGGTPPFGGGRGGEPPKDPPVGGPSSAPGARQPVSLVTVDEATANGVVGDLGTFLRWSGDDVSKYLDGNIPNVNLDSFASTSDVQAAMEFLADKVVVPKETQGWEETVRSGMAELLGQPVDRMKYVFDNQFTSARHIWAAKTLLENASKQVADFSKTYDPARATTEDRAKAWRMVQQLSDLYAYNTGIRAEAGRALNASKIMSAENKKIIAQLEEMINVDAGGPQRIDQIMSALGSAETAAEATQIARVAVHGNKFWNSAVELWMAGVLSGAKTFMVNAAGVTFNLAREFPEREVGAAMGAGRSAVSAVNPDGSVGRVAPGESIPMFVGLLEGLPEALLTFGRAFKSGEPVFSNAKKAELSASDVSNSKIPEVRNPAISAENYGLPSVFKDGATFRGAANELMQDRVTVAGSVVDVLGATIRTPLNLIQSTDEFYKVLAYRMQLNARAYRDVMNYGVEGLKEKVDLFLEMKRNPSDEVKFDAMSFADYVTLQKAMGETGRELQGVINKGYTKYEVPIMKFIVPFQKTLVNIFKQGFIERTPLGFLSSEVQADIKAGGAKADAARARLYTGTVLTMWGAYEAAKGNITGPAPSQPSAKDAFFASGRRPFSVKIPDGFNDDGSPRHKWVPYNRMQPVSMPFALGSTIGAFMYYSDPENPEQQKTLENMINTAVAGTSQYVTDQAFMINMANFVDAMRGSKSAHDFAANFTASWVPSAAFDMVRKDDRIVRASNEFFDKAMSRMPGFAEGLPPMTDKWGNPRLRDDGVFFGWTDPFTVSEESEHPIDREIFRLGVDGVDTGDGTKRIFPEALLTPPERAIDGYRLSDEEYYEFSQFFGPNALKDLNELVESPDYKNAPPFAKATQIRSVWEKNLRYAREIFKQRPELIDHQEKTLKLNRELDMMGIK